MNARSLAVTVLILASAAVCVRLGFWQLSRWEEKKAINASRRAAMEQPAVVLEAPLPGLEAIRDRRVDLRGVYDESRQILLTGRGFEGEMGIHLVTPLVLANDSAAVLIDRGWVLGPDVTRVNPADFPVPGRRSIQGVALPIEREQAGPPLRVAGSEQARVFSMRSLHHDSLSARFPYSLAPYVVRELPGAGPRTQPIRLAPQFSDPSTHLGYAVQWFVISAIILGGAAGLAFSRRRAAQHSR